MSEAPYFFDREGKPLERERYHELFENERYRVVAFNLVEGNEGDPQEKRAWVSTIWLGFDAGIVGLFNGDARPLIFETCSFRKGLQRDQRRYATEAEALAGHNQAVELMRAVVGAERYAFEQGR